ncbi:MAG: hypothetical protein QOJ30_2914 [Pseudonocardiales bacterium]|nr:hypothetical protein [Pseudonocardiales bacterium]
MRQDVPNDDPAGIFAGRSPLVRLARPAQLDPVVAPSVPPADPGYLSIPGGRAAAFFHLPNADPAVVAHEEATRSEIPAGVGANINVYVPATLGIDVPVLAVYGRFDEPFCAQGGGGSVADCADDATLYAAEAPFFSPAARLQTTVVPDAGRRGPRAARPAASADPIPPPMTSISRFLVAAVGAPVRTRECGTSNLPMKAGPAVAPAGSASD